MESFRQVLGDDSFGAIFGGKSRPFEDEAGVFAMIQTLSKPEHCRKFPPDYFDYVVVDEFHHSEAASYRKVLDYFEPRFLLGLTATPERMDGRDVLRLCDYNVA